MHNEPVKTSVFSQYQNNENDSISSRQLQYWLKQTAPVAQPKFAGLEWTLMSTNSIFEQDQHTLRRNQTFQSLNKQNDQTAYNSARPIINNSSAATKSKSYLNAMVDLQNKVKHLDFENSSLKHSLKCLKDERNKAMSESSHLTEELKCRIDVLQPRTRKMEELVRDNKMLRDIKEENAKKYKMLDKVNKQNQIRLAQYEKQLQRLKDDLKIKDKLILQSQKKTQEESKITERFRDQILKLKEKNKILENMKQKSTTSIIEKYNKSVQAVQSLSTQKMQLIQEVHHLSDRVKGQEEAHKRENDENVRLIERLKQEVEEKRGIVSNLDRQGTYFKEKYELTNQELKAVLRKYSNDIIQIKQQHEKGMKRLRQQAKEKEIVYVERIVEVKKQEIDLNKESQIKHTEDIRNQIESQLQFQQFNQVEEEQLEEDRLHQTRSLEKQPPKNSFSKHKPSDCLSYENRKVTQQQQKSSTKRKFNHITSKSKKVSNQIKNPRQNSKSRSKSRQKDRQKAVNFEQEHSFILKSCQPVTQHENVDQLMYSREPYYYHSANNQTRQKGPYYWEHNEVGQFACSQRANVQNDEFSLQRALLAETNRQAIRLIEEQERCIQVLNDNVTPNERSENVGRMKQISEQIRVNNEKMLELKNKICFA